MPGIKRLPAVEEHVQLSRSQIYLLVSRGEFPKPIQLSARAVAWRSEDLDRWIESRAEATPAPKRARGRAA